MGILSSLSKSATSSWLDASEILLLVSGLVLVIGIAGEYAKSDRWKRWLRVFEIMVILSVAGELVADVGVYSFSRRLQMINEAEVAALNIEAAQARKDAGIAEEQAGEAIKQASVLDRETVVLERQLLAQSRRANLLKDPKRQREFIARIEPFAKQRFDIRYCRDPDTEISFLALTMMGHVTGAGWDLGEFSPGLGCSVGVGLMLHPRASASTKSAATALMQALYDAGLVLTPKPQWMLCEDRQPGPGETMLKPSTVDSIIIDIESHP